MLECRNIQKAYGGVVAVKNVSLRVEPGEVHALCGENGAGKSSLARIVAGITQPDGGEILLDGRRVVWSGPQQAREVGVSIILQELDLFAHLSIAENLAIGNPKLEGSGWASRSALNQAAKPLLHDVGLDLDPSLPLDSLSVSHWQLIAIARVLGIDAKVIFMDEPTSALTDDAVERLFGLIARLKARGVSIVYVSHKMDEIFRICDRVSVMRDGALIATENCASTTIDRVIRQMVGREVQIQRRSLPAPAADIAPILELSNVTTRKLKDISVALRPGEILGVAGLVASGRSELGRALFGLSPILSGTISLAGAPFEPGNPREALNQGLALVPEDRGREGLFAGMSIRHNATLAHLREFSTLGWIDNSDEKYAATEALQRCNTKLAHDELPVSALSGGNQQKVLIGKWLMTQPRVCFFDDPTRGIDIGAKDDIYKLLNKLAGEGLGVIWVSSELPELLANAHRILVLYEGRVMGILDAGSAAQEDIMRLATSHHLIS